ncbi:MAG: hypothetical protein CMG71_01950 [Candidatus Marinimicrobia bacterium]|nr:hypothetical protein [Candidatus Neomarinimicrobiota bacterium]
MIRYFYLIFGFLSVSLGVLGTVLPVIPTTPLFILSAWCFSKSSKRLEHWIVNNRISGPIINNWRKYKGLTRKSKISAVSIIIPSILYSCYLIENVFTNILLIFVCLMLCVYLTTRPEPPKMDLIND